MKISHKELITPFYRCSLNSKKWSSTDLRPFDATYGYLYTRTRSIYIEKIAVGRFNQMWVGFIPQLSEEGYRLSNMETAINYFTSTSIFKVTCEVPLI